MKSGEIMSGYCSSNAEEFKNIDPILKPELLVTPRFYKFTLKLLNINDVGTSHEKLVGS